MRRVSFFKLRSVPTSSLRLAAVSASFGLLSVAGASVLGGCSTVAYCFADCEGTTTASTTTSTTGSGGDGGGCVLCLDGGVDGSGAGGGGTGTGGCVPSNGGVETCDEADNDCNGILDDIPGMDDTAEKTCGTCTTDCYKVPMSNWDPATVHCDPPPEKWTPGKCSGSCAQDFWNTDNNPDGLCKYYCVKIADDDSDCNGLDDDCDGQTDEDVDLCHSATDCGYCGHTCALAHAVSQCVKTNAAPLCDAMNTQCTVQQCVCNGPGDCYHNIDGNPVNGCEYKCDVTNGGVEICDGLDNDCDGSFDDSPIDLQLGQVCFGSTNGICAAPTNAGVWTCAGGHVICDGPNVKRPGDIPESCNSLDDDCNGIVDDNPNDTGPAHICGQSGWSPCKKGTLQCAKATACTTNADCLSKICNGGTCQGGVKVCVGHIDPATETCDGVDNDCNGTIDDNLPAPTACNVPPGGPCVQATDCTSGVCNGGVCQPVPPAGLPSPCKAGVTACVAGKTICQGSTVAVPGMVDGCGVDDDCNGQLSNQPDLQTDPRYCGSCANDCVAGAHQADWTCTNGSCVFLGCKPGYFDNGGGTDVAGDHKCDYPCVFTSAQESCNGVDDNCDGQIDENVITPAPTSVCGVSFNAHTPECLPFDAVTNTHGMEVICQGGQWVCSSHTTGVCVPDCATAAEVCDVASPGSCSNGHCVAGLVGVACTRNEDCFVLDNNCNGMVNENVINWRQPCASDAGKPPPGDGVCRSSGLYQCNTLTTVACDAVKDLGQAGAELCDGIDNDCDGAVDEPFTSPGTNTQHFVKPVVTRVASSLWIYTYEASRPSATNLAAGDGNGYVTAAPAGKTMDKTPACSVLGKIPWFDVTGNEVDQTCSAMGGHTCSLTEWKTACASKTASCTYAYKPTGAACTSSFTTTKYCNLGVSYDFDPSAAGVQNGLLPTGSNLLAACSSDWSGSLGNVTGVNDQIMDMTGNLREITKIGTNQYALMGGAFLSGSDVGATCGFDFYKVDQSFELYDTGFRCCFSQDPTVYTCGNNIKDGSETAVDCGGVACKKCASGATCAVDSDCTSGTCLTTLKCQ